jgi:saccharopine dehydrogenase (NAD+, L-lysine-forming)
MAHLWLRSETKDHERRSPLSAKSAKRVLDAGHSITVENFEDRIFPLSEFKEIGCNITFTHWKDAPADAIILGLKELADDDFGLSHKHIHFAHVFKGQDGFEKTLKRFKKGGGTLFDLEYLVDKNRRRVCAFGYWAGYVGAAISLKKLLLKKTCNESNFEIQSFEDRGLLLAELCALRDQCLDELEAIVIGANGRCGRGATDLLTEYYVQVHKWDKRDTRLPGPYQKLTEVDLFVNCVLMTKKIPPFYTKELISDQKLSVIGDVSCDPNSELNPIPVYDEITSWEVPFVGIGSGIDLLGVDNLPSVLPKESSLDFADQLCDHLISFLDDESYSVFQSAKDTFTSAIKNI